MAVAAASSVCCIICFWKANLIIIATAPVCSTFKPSAQFVHNRKKSRKFHIRNGAKQGYLLSLLFFNTWIFLDLILRKALTDRRGIQWGLNNPSEDHYIHMKMTYAWSRTPLMICRENFKGSHLSLTKLVFLKI